MKQKDPLFNKIPQLIVRSVKNELTGPEEAELQRWADTDERNAALMDQLSSETLRQEELQKFGNYNEDKAFSLLMHQLKKERTKKLFTGKNRWLAVAASFLLFFSIATYIFLHRDSSKQPLAINQAHDFRPGGNKAILTLGNGQKIVLTGAQNGKLAQQGGTVIKKTADGQVSYSAAATTTVMLYNTMTTPRGGQYTLTLSDGTTVTLNAASSITYPIAFTGAERKVVLTGEAYFEVAHNKAKPFRVESGGQTVEVLGTHFNINAYDDEPAIKTTLLEGSVKVLTKKLNALLKPGQQAVNNHTGKIDVANADVNEEVAWKNGLFTFTQADIHLVMRQLARWYNVDVVYEGKIPATKITGNVHRSVNASQALKILTYLDIHYRVEGRTIIITP